MEICTVGRENDTDFQTAYTTLKNWLYGTDTEGQTTGTDPYLPSPAAIIELFGGSVNTVNPEG
jgi:hypothetical protein